MAWPHLLLLAQNIPKSVTTETFYMKISRKNTFLIRDTQQMTNTSTIMTTPTPLIGTRVQTLHVAVKIIDITIHVVTYHTRILPAGLSKGNQYTMVAHIRDTNAIIAAPLKNISETQLIGTYSHLFYYLTTHGHKPLSQKCDNEYPAAFKRFIRDNEITFQLAPMYGHHTNLDEKSINNFK